MELNKIINEDCLYGMKNIPDNSIDCCVTSPPYYGLRDYGHDEQIGLEETPELYVSEMVQVFMEVKRVLKPTGTLFLNLGDSYNGSGKASGGGGIGYLQQSNKGSMRMTTPTKLKGLKPKDLIGIPWMVAFALRTDGWYLRQDIIWSKPNPMPESVIDRCTKAHEYIFLMSKSSKYYYDAESIKTISIDENGDRGSSTNRKRFPTDKVNGIRKGGFYPMANKRSVWTVTTQPYNDAHFATFPEELIYDCIKAGCPLGGIVLDPFMGSGTTAIVAKKLGRNYIGFELNEEYIEMAEKRLYDEIGMFL